MPCRRALALLLVAVLASSAFAQPPTESQLAQLESQITRVHEGLELHKTEPAADTGDQALIMLRSKHFVFGMPRVVDGRHNFTPLGDDVKRPGVSVLVREGFVVAHFDRMRAPLFVCQRWTRADQARMEQEERIGRNWKEDTELPLYARAGGTSYEGSATGMDRGHMARHEDNHAWGLDSANWGCRMSNSAPQHVSINRGPSWRDLEDAVQEIVADGEIEVVWTISGTLYRDTSNPEDEPAEADFAATEFIGDGYGVPKATYKIVSWFDGRGLFQARGYVFEQDEDEPQPDPDPVAHIVPIDVIEERAGVDFFGGLKDYIENLVERQDHDDMWGAQP